MPGPGSGGFFQDTLQVHPCKLLASFDLQGGRKCRRIAGSNPCPAGDGPERIPRSPSSDTYPRDLVPPASARLNSSAMPQRQASGGGETCPGAYVSGMKHPSPQGRVYGVSRASLPAAACAPKLTTGTSPHRTRAVQLSIGCGRQAPWRKCALFGASGRWNGAGEVPEA